MRLFFRIIGATLTIVKLSGAYSGGINNHYTSDKQLEYVQNISNNKLLDFNTIVKSYEKEFADSYKRARFYQIISHEIDRRMKELDRKALGHEAKFTKTIKSYESALDLPTFCYQEVKPQFNHIYQKAEINEKTVSKDIHRIQADLLRIQFIQVYQFYKERLDFYKDYIYSLRDLYKNKINKNRDNQVAYYSDFPQMYQGIKRLHNSINDAGNMRVERNPLGKVRFIDFEVEGQKRRRNFEYNDDGLLSKLTDGICNGGCSDSVTVISKILFGENQKGEDFFDYLFSPGFISQNYNYYTEIIIDENQRESAYKLISMDGHTIGTVYREYDGNHLVKETWCKGETSKILRQFTSILDSKSGGYKIIERDRNGQIINQEIVLSSND